MSGFIRTLQKRMAKKMGYERQTQKVVVNNGIPSIVKLGRGEGAIIGPDGEPIGKHWPQVSAATREVAKINRVPRGSRRGTHKKAA